jgi:hypothetical protein
VHQNGDGRFEKTTKLGVSNSGGGRGDDDDGWYKQQHPLSFDVINMWFRVANVIGAFFPFRHNNPVFVSGTRLRGIIYVNFATKSDQRVFRGFPRV